MIKRGKDEEKEAKEWKINVLGGVSRTRVSLKSEEATSRLPLNDVET